MTTAVTVTGRTVALGGRPILRGIDLAVEPGGFVALMGPTAPASPTLVRALVGLRPLLAGEVRLFDTPSTTSASGSGSASSPARDRRGRRTGVGVGGRRRRSAHPPSPAAPLSRADRAAIDDALEVVGLADRRRDAVSNLSGGQQQRVLIARALAGEPELFFLDEATAGVDLPSQQVLADTLSRLRDRGATIVLVAHEARPLAPSSTVPS